MRYVIGAIILFLGIPSVFASNWTAETYSLKDKIVALGMGEGLAKEIINECKDSAANPRRCVELAVSISNAESTLGNGVTACNNVFGVTGVCFKTKEEAVKDWVKRYNKNWYNQTTPSSFYSATPKVKPRTRYCMSEHSSNSRGFCPNGHRASWEVYLKLKSN